MSTGESVVKPVVYVRFFKGWLIRQELPGDDIRSPYINTRELKDGSRVDELSFNRLEGHIHDVYNSTKQYGNNKLEQYINLHMMTADGEERKIQVKLFSKAGQAILDRIENIDYSKPIVVRTGVGPDDEYGFLWIKQFGDNVKSNYTKADRGDKPEWKSISLDDGTIIWDKSDQLRWWLSKLVTIRQDITTKRVTL